MYINTVELLNVGAYRDKHVYDFNGVKNINIVLGENGNGKTTLLNSIICCLYGTYMFGSSHITNEYKDYILRLKNKDTKKTSMYMEVDFKYINDNYKVRRSYKVFKEDFEESLVVYKNDQLINNFDMNSIISKTLFELFFFNGENILDVIDDNKIDYYVNDLIDKAFEFNVINNLQKDIDKIKANEIKKIQSDKYNFLLNENNKLHKEINSLNNKLADLKKENELNLSNINKLKKLIEEKGLLRDKENKQLEKKELEIKTKLNQNKDFIKKEIRNINVLLHKDFLIKENNYLNKTRKKRLEKIVEIYNNMEKDIDLDISLGLERNIIRKYKHFNEYDCDLIVNITKENKKLKEQLIKIRNKFTKNKSGQEYISYIDNIDYLENLYDKNKKEINLLNLNLNNLENELTINNQDLEKEDKLNNLNNQEKNSIKEKEKLSKVLDEYLKVQRKGVIEEVQKETLNILNNKLLRKNQLIDDIKISNEVKFYKSKKKLNLKTLSSGEKQMIITSFLFSIIKVSKIHSVLVLDTFIGRLDNSHTKNLFEYFKKDINNQIIILTTNRELSKEDYKILQKDISKIYTLKNDGYNINIKEGYYEN